MAPLRPIHTVKTAGYYFVEDGASQMGAAVAYYSLFSIAPLLIIAIAVAGLAFGEEEARARVVSQISGVMGKEGTYAVEVMLKNFRQPPDNPWAAVVGLASLWYGAISVFTQLRVSLCRIWRVQPASQHVVVGFIKDYLLAFLMVLVSNVFVLLLLAASTVLSVLLAWWTRLVPQGQWLMPVADFGVSSFLFGVLFAMTYRFMSEGQVGYRKTWLGAAVAAMLFAVGKMAIAYYLAHVQIASVYGAAGSLVIFLIWVYYSSQIFFFGAEIIRVRLGK